MCTSRFEVASDLLRFCTRHGVLALTTNFLGELDCPGAFGAEYNRWRGNFADATARIVPRGRLSRLTANWCGGKESGSWPVGHENISRESWSLVVCADIGLACGMLHAQLSGVCVMYMLSRTQKNVAIVEAEIVAMAKGMKEAIFLRYIWSFIFPETVMWVVL